MAEDVCTHNIPDTISRQALGRIARLGDLYDARNDKFCGVSIFQQRLPRDSSALTRTDNPVSNFSFVSDSSHREKLNELGVTGEQGLSVLAGMCGLSGSAKYLSRRKKSFRSVETTMLYGAKTVTEHLDLSNTVAKSCISKEAAYHSRATHVVVEIEWGANFIVSVTDENSQNRNRREVEENTKAQIEKLKETAVKGTGETEGASMQEETGDWKRFSFEIFGDVLPEGSDEFPHTLKGALALMRKVPQLIQRYNDGKGKPLTYIMLPVSYLASHKPTQLPETFVSVGETWAMKIIKLFDRMAELGQKVHDMISDLNNHSFCVPSRELEEACRTKYELDLQEARAKDELAKLLERIRSASEEVECLDAFCAEHCKSIEETFRECDEVFGSVQPRIELRKRCEKYGAKYLAPPFDQRIASACDDHENVYVLFHGLADSETTAKNESAFIQLAKENKNHSKTVCYFTWPEESGDVTIKHFRKGKLIHGDVSRQLETKNLATCRPIPVTRQSLCLMPFKVRCPGSFDGDCGKEERTWTCINCNETLQFCPYNRALCCNCGKTTANRFRFRCHGDAHGPDFAQFKDDTLQRALGHHTGLMMASKGMIFSHLFIIYLN